MICRFVAEVRNISWDEVDFIKRKKKVTKNITLLVREYGVPTAPSLALFHNMPLRDNRSTPKCGLIRMGELFRPVAVYGLFLENVQDVQRCVDIAVQGLAHTCRC